LPSHFSSMEQMLMLMLIYTYKIPAVVYDCTGRA